MPQRMKVSNLSDIKGQPFPVELAGQRYDFMDSSVRILEIWLTPALGVIGVGILGCVLYTIDKLEWLVKFGIYPLIFTWILLSALALTLMLLDDRKLNKKMKASLDLIHGKELVFSEKGIFYSRAILEAEFNSDVSKSRSPEEFFFIEHSSISAWTLDKMHFGRGGTEYFHFITFNDQTEIKFYRRIFGNHEAELVDKLNAYLPGKVFVRDQIKTFKGRNDHRLFS